MDYYNSQRPSRPPLHSSVSTGSFSRISTVSDITDLDSFPEGTTNIPLLGRPSLVSLQSDDGGRSRSDSEENGYSSPPSSGWSPHTGYSPSGYATVPPPASTPSPRQHGRPYAPNAAPSRRHHDVIPEEEDGVDLVLMQSAAPVGFDGPPSFTAQESPEPAFDLSSTLGPMTWADEQFIKGLQKQEAQGKLTGGLGLGIKTDSILTEKALLATSPVVEKSPRLSRAFSFSRAGGPASSLSLADAVKQLGQSEANKRGKVIEVVMETDPQDQSEVDLSVVAGPDKELSNKLTMRQNTFPVKGGQTQVFYPQPDWKPFSMRWPYLMFMILLSIALAGGQEVLYQKSTRDPLVKFRTPSDIPAGEYFAFKFLPTMIAVSYGVLWQLCDFEVRRLEAFYQLSKEGGALAAESINVDYITDFSFLRPIRAFSRKHYAVTISSITSLLANALVPTLGAACILLSPDRDTRLRHPGSEKSILIHYVWSRFLSVTFLVIACLGCVLFYQLQVRRSGLLADVKGIAGLASMATVSHILMDFKDMDVATHKDIHHKIRDHRYALRNSSLTPDDLNPPSKQERERYKKNHLSENPQPLMLRTKGAIPFIIGILLFLALIPVFLFTPATALTDKVPWVVTLLAVCIKLSWGALETDVRMMEPYYILSRRYAPPKTLTLDYTAMPIGWVAIQGMLNGHWLVFFVGFGTIMTEILTVLVTSLATVEGRVFIALTNKAPPPRNGDPPSSHADDVADINAGQETVFSFWISLALAIFVLMYMGIVALIVFVRRRRVFLPRQPNTIASVLAYIHQSKMLYDFVNTAKLSNKEMVDKLEALGKTYGLGWFQGRDGSSHCGVDEEELLSDYKFGYDYSRATNPWDENEVQWL
ncbi:hypothetical protein B0H63DRAFT_310638 [Podospora didyma]|uniref:Spray n=1 Tax=Podospora didyma TaxID=330526 RepID=A0AAE0K506_9PEZI|nr:hypothetical protein B0H63DRAFT_310638 [Podospora didyma]